MKRSNNIKYKNKNFSLLFVRSFNNYCNNIVFKHAIKIYKDALNERNLIREDNNKKIGIYSWINKVNGKFFIGSGYPLYLRISDYYQNLYLLSCYNVYIVKSLIKYGMNNFSLAILEYSDSENLILCEQKWIDFLNPEYNFSPIAGNTKGYKHTVESIEEIRKASIGRKHTKEIKQIMSNSRKGENNPFYGNYYSNNVFKHAIKIYNDPLNQRNLIRTENRGKAGVYAWINNINGKFYIGKGNSLYLRISDYYQKWYIESHNNLHIVRSLSKYKMSNFTLVILKYTDSNSVISYEKEFINLLKPEYNVKFLVNNTKNLNE